MGGVIRHPTRHQEARRRALPRRERYAWGELLWLAGMLATAATLWWVIRARAAGKNGRTNAFGR